MKKVASFLFFLCVFVCLFFFFVFSLPCADVIYHALLSTAFVFQKWLFWATEGCVRALLLPPLLLLRPESISGLLFLNVRLPVASTPVTKRQRASRFRVCSIASHSRSIFIFTSPLAASIFFSSVKNAASSTIFMPKPAKMVS